MVQEAGLPSGESASHHHAADTPLGWRHAGCREEDETPSDGFLGYLIDKLGLQGPFMTVPCICVLCVTLRVPGCAVFRGT